MQMNKIKHSIVRAIPATWKSSSWLLKLMIPIFLAVTLMQHYGILSCIAEWINPVFVYLGLPGESAVAFISGAAAGTYAGLAVMMSIPLTMKQATILALMIALCHALPMECAVNKKTGSSFWMMCIIRIVMAFLCASSCSAAAMSSTARPMVRTPSEVSSWNVILRQKESRLTPLYALA